MVAACRAAQRAGFGFCLLGGLALTTLLGCQSAKVPRLDARAASRAKLAALTNLTSVAETNLLNLEWLKPPTNSFTLGPGDILGIEILGDAMTRATNAVGPDGRIYYYLLPGLDVWGLTLAETRALIERELLKYLREQADRAVPRPSRRWSEDRRSPGLPTKSRIYAAAS